MPRKRTAPRTASPQAIEIIAVRIVPVVVIPASRFVRVTIFGHEFRQFSKCQFVSTLGLGDEPETRRDFKPEARSDAEIRNYLKRSSWPDWRQRIDESSAEDG